MSGADPAEEFTRLFACHRNRIFRYIRALVPHLTDAEDVFQETSVILWREFPSYRRDAAFLPWALAIAFNRVRTHRHRRRQARLYFGEALIETLAAESEALSEDLDARSEALRGCREKLRPEDRELIDVYYAGDASVGDLAEVLGRPANTLYKALQRIRRALRDCIDRGLTAGEGGVS